MPYGYKQLISEKNFLKVQQRARALMGTGSDLIAIYYKDRMLIFKTRSGTYKNVVWTQKILITDATMDNIMSAKSFKSIEDIIKNSGLKISCDCPAFSYWGFKYIAWKKGYGLEKELRRPIIRNPQQRGASCKHLHLVLQLYPFWAKALASKFRNYYTKQIESTGIQGIERARLNTVARDKALQESGRIQGSTQISLDDTPDLTSTTSTVAPVFSS